ncbi:mpv17-like protein isoform X1 [Eupeodes corollae]|uniref:mpv17-like protein isoform X1 n=1 Tax=Eupeodes corollae TaxID=290404 RepID=UPI002492D17F|nr:mpv17-like protein isoform X1 [Eupeodes corollae]XP_055905615.1 mpv17-like protein isoform X1 [Eupeodes corollae]XP_055905616.1 mpv17-like protein isoform X1 [Eupeodes corollae]
MIKRFVTFTNKYKIIRGVLSYGALWPCGSLIEQTLIEKRSFGNYDWVKCFKFSIFGAFFMGPTLYVWMRLAAVMWPKRDVSSSICKAITEQASYDPMAISVFMFTMSLFDGKTFNEAQWEVRNKFFDAYKVGVIYWPCVQTVNFTFIPQRNQVVFTSFFSMLWTAFLAYTKYLEIPDVDLEHHVIDIHFLEM